MFAHVTNPITNWIFPRRCVVCDRDIMQDLLCCDCHSLVTRASKKITMLKEAKPALFFYEGVVRSLIIAAKFHKSASSSHVLMNLAQKELERSGLVDEIKARAPDCVSFVPTHWGRQILRGVDMPQRFAVTLASMMSLPLVPSLVRTNFFHRQQQLRTKSERMIAIRGKFALKRKYWSCRCMIVVDDIVTSGATFDESKKVLKEIAGDVVCLAIARTP